MSRCETCRLPFGLHYNQHLEAVRERNGIAFDTGNTYGYNRRIGEELVTKLRGEGEQI